MKIDTFWHIHASLKKLTFFYYFLKLSFKIINIHLYIQLLYRHECGRCYKNECINSY